MPKKNFLVVLGLQVAAAALAVCAFAMIDEKRMAAHLAGLGFVVLGVAQFLVVWPLPNRAALWLYRFNWVYLFAFAVPMLTIRLAVEGDLGDGFRSYHRAAEVVFMCLVLANVVDYWRHRRRS